MGFYCLVLLAWLRGLRYRWPTMPKIPQGYHGVGCSMRCTGVKPMYVRHGWIPHSFQWIRGYGCHGIAQQFIVKDETE
jgi:hypothetical protein